MPITLDEVHAKFPSDHCRQVTAEYYIDALPDVPTRFIDIGAGDGRSFDAAKRKLTNLDWVGIDIEDSPEVRMRTRQDCEFVSYDGVKIPFPDNRFDVAYSRQVFEHVRYPEQLLKEIYRVLKPGGLFIGSVSQLEPYHSYSFWNFTYYGFAVICSDAGLKLHEYRPGIDGFTLCARHAILFWLRQNIRDFFTPLFETTSPANSYIESVCRSNNSETSKINLDKVTYCGHLCFKFWK
jgi:SAM-dependent methyltransferase